MNIEHIAQETTDEYLSKPKDERDLEQVILAALTMQQQAYEKELATAREDVKRLDWLESKTRNEGDDWKKWFDVTICGPKNHGGAFATGWLISVDSNAALSEASGPTLREAIDAATKGDAE